MRKLTKIIAIMPVLLILSACGINTGTVSDKVVEPERKYMTQSCVFIGKVMSCHPVPQVDDEDYCLTLTNEDKETNYVCFDDKLEWASINEGDYYDAANK